MKKLNECNNMYIPIFDRTCNSSPLIYHILLGNSECVQLLLKYGANMNNDCEDEHLINYVNNHNRNAGLNGNEDMLFAEKLCLLLTKKYSKNDNILDIYALVFTAKLTRENNVNKSAESAGGKSVNKRKCPKNPAKEFKLKTVKKGLDGKKWIVSKRSDGIKIWKRL